MILLLTLMIETNETGQKQIEKLMKNVDDPIFNEWEKSFIKDLGRMKYEKLSTRQKSVITRLIGWLDGA